MLRVEIRALDDGAVDVAGSVPVAELGFGDAENHFEGSVQVTGRLTSTGAGQYFWRGRLGVRTRMDCRRCLQPVRSELDVPVDVLFVENGDTEDADVYLVERDAPVLDLSGMVREELVLATPEWVLCRETCRGLCAGCGSDLNLGPCVCVPETDPRWAALEALKTDPVQEGS